MAIRGGSWGIGGFRLPEFGITERIQNIVKPNAPRTAQGGSNLFGAPKPQAQAPAPMYGPQRPTGQVQGINTGGGTTGGGVTGGGSPAPATPAPTAGPMQGPEQYYEPQPQGPSVDFDALIAPALQAYTEAEGAQQTGYEANLKEIETGGQTRKTGAETAKKASETQFKQRAERTSSTAESAINESRRAAAELQQGISARYGTGVSTGLGAGAILGAQSVRNIGALRAQLSTALNEIETARTGVQETYNNALKEIDAQVETQKQQARAGLQQNLASIGQARGELQARKAELAYNAMEQYRQEVNAVNQRNTAFKQQLYTQAQAAEQKLQQIQTQAQSRYQSLGTPSFQPYKAGDQLFTFNKQTGQYTAGPVGKTAVSGFLDENEEEQPLSPTGVTGQYGLNPDEEQLIFGP